MTRIKAKFSSQEAKQFIRNMKASVYDSIAEFQHDVGKKAVEIVQNHIKYQDLDWDRLADSTVKKKGHGDAWRDSGLLMNNIAYNSGNSILTVGVRSNIFYSNGKSLAQIVQWNEYGKNKESGGKNFVPSRPLFGPSSKELNNWIRSGAVKMPNERIVNKAK